jgi:hypothetical protein
MIIRLLLVLITLLQYTSLVYSDEPLAPPKTYTIHSPSKKFVATIDPNRGVKVRSADSSKTLWKAPKIWSRSALLADDGEHLVTGYDDLDLIPLDYTKDLVLITFWRRDKKIKDITVGDLFPDTKVLRRTASHYHWGSLKTITETTLTVKLCDNSKVIFDIATGKQISPVKSNSSLIPSFDGAWALSKMQTP